MSRYDLPERGLWVEEVVLAMRAAMVIGQRSCRDGDHLNYRNLQRLIEGAPTGLKSRDEMNLEAAEVPAIDTFAMFAAEMLGISHEAAMQRADVQEAGALVAKATLGAAWEVADED